VRYYVRHFVDFDSNAPDPDLSLASPRKTVAGSHSAPVERSADDTSLGACYFVAAGSAAVVVLAEAAALPVAGCSTARPRKAPPSPR
jgi:hypothetical protein